MYCSSCGEEVDPSATFCENCGEAVSSGESGETDPSRETATRTPESAGTGGGLEPNVAGALSYLLGFVTGLVFFLIEEEDEFVRFHAAQSIVVFGGLFVLNILFSFVNSFIASVLFAGGGFFLWSIITMLLSLIWFIIALATLVLWIFLMVKAYQGERPRIPIAANIADDLV